MSLNWNHFEMRLLNLRINFYFLRTFCPHLGSFFLFFLFLLSLRFDQISPLAFFRWFLPRPWIGMMSLASVSPVITAFHSCCLSHLISKWFHFKRQLQKFGTDSTLEDQIRIYKTKKSILDRTSGRIEALSLYSSRWALSEDSGFKSYPSRPEVYLVKNVVR